MGQFVVIAFLCGLIALAVPGPSNAAVNPAPIDNCTVDLAANQEAFSFAKKEADISKIRAPLLEQALKLLSDSPLDSSKPIMETMSPNNLVRFTEIRSRLIFTSVQEYLVSEHDRDVDAISIMWKVVASRLDGKPYKSIETRVSVLSSLIQDIDKKLADQSVIITAPENINLCNIPLALSIAESNILNTEKQQSPNSNAAILWINGLVSKHPEMNGTMNYSKLTASEQIKYKKLISDVIRPAIERQQAVKDAEFLKTMYKLSAERTTDGEADLTRSGGDSEAIGSTFKARPRDVMTQVLIDALYFLGDTIPSQAAVMNQQTVDLMQSLKPPGR